MTYGRLRWTLIVAASGLAVTLPAASARASAGLGADSLSRPPLSIPTLSVAPGSAFT
jgi:hypothetical protein